MIYFWTILQIVLEAIRGKIHNKVLDYGAFAARIAAAARAAYEAETGQPLDESKIPVFVPIE
jgi:hypothetical protein